MWGLLRNVFKESKPVLGRWQLKNCQSLNTQLNVYYQNRDHCGDLICGTFETDDNSAKAENAKKSRKRSS